MIAHTPHGPASSCSEHDSKSEINDFSGRISCSTSSDRGSATVNLHHVGKLSADRMTVEAYTQSEISGSAFTAGDQAETAQMNKDTKDMKATYTFQRQGDCNG